MKRVPNPKQLKPNDRRRCQAVEERLVADRTRSPHYRAVQCSLLRHDEATPHIWLGRTFGSPAVAKRRSRMPSRCANTEVREVGHRKYKEVIRLLRVRCSEPAGHDGGCVWMGRPFGQQVKKRKPGRSGTTHAARRSAARAAAGEG